MNKQNYTCYRFYRCTKKPKAMKTNLTRQQAVEFCESYPTRKVRGIINSFVGFKKDS